MQFGPDVPPGVLPLEGTVSLQAAITCCEKAPTCPGPSTAHRNHTIKAARSTEFGGPLLKVHIAKNLVLINLTSLPQQFVL